ncbi:hypothetical protein P691DRAFT_356889 [Macrolepiota fuliginosa MF-IS2]|uniref:Nephrocystin 3-like N-terminal domain-containing protein n=1 Tax=Macrolepiota fuliginosa MF-IS2 TaxID=1400762 RepID=A0A9P5X559_9AGAR|nr:hypothetical protein P691DRAFT_356889 [Macrolepiota fuliginosa MF-IS2]
MIETQKAGTQNVGMQNIVAQHVHNHNTEVNPLEKMLLHVIPGAEFNSAVRDPPPKCHPDTRIQIREDLHNRINGTTKLIWMHGPAGVGKSAIMQTIAETVPTCATLFFSRSSDPPRNDSKKVFTTLAYRIAANNAEYREYIEERIYQDPAFLAISLTEQFDRLFTVPFTHNYVQPGSQRWVVLLDGLDECKNEQNDQCRIVDLIGDSNLRHAGATPFIWVIASRPEAHLMAALRKLKGSFRDRPTEFWELEIPADSNDAAQDIERYLHTEFTKIREGSPDSFPTPASTWPSDGDFLKAARASSGLFVFASTLTKYISVDRPPSRLRLIISLIDRSTLDFTRISQRPFSLLDILYTQIMSDIPEDLLSVAKSLLGYYRFVSEGLISGKGLVIACNVLGLCQDEVYDALRKLHSVLKCPSPGNARHGIEFFHASFPDFLFDHSRSQCYYVDLEQELTNTWRCYLRILKESCQIDPTFAIPNSNSVNIQWVPGDDEPGCIKVQEELLWEAHHGCISLLIEYGHSWCASCPQPKYGRRLLVDAPEFVDVFRGAYSVLFHTDVHLTKKFADWFNDHVRKKRLQRD